ncbi:hypothetical protein K438DRAFT_1536917, partial [Mycena galopus ATCC 62051]
TPLAKRQRTDSNATLTRSEIWFSDGNIVLQAARTQFRVHWGILALHSPIFRDMQGLPQPPDQPSVDGCSVVELSDDPVDVKIILKALYTPAAPFPRKEGLPLPVIGALIRLGRKYDFNYLLEPAVACLTSQYPTTLIALAAVRGRVQEFKTIQWFRGIEFDIIALARENKILSILPYAYYCLAEKFTLLFDGTQREDGTLASLCPDDFRACTVGQQKLLI